MKITEKMQICPKCAKVRKLTECPYCKTLMMDIGVYWDEWCAMNMRQKDELVNHCIETMIKDTYDPESAKLSEESWKMQNTSSNASYYSGPRCPYCKSEFVSKISFFDRLLDTTLWGLASDVIGKTHKCNSCGSTW